MPLQTHPIPLGTVRTAQSVSCRQNANACSGSTEHSESFCPLAKQRQSGPFRPVRLQEATERKDGSGCRASPAISFPAVKPKSDSSGHAQPWEQPKNTSKLEAGGKGFSSGVDGKDLQSTDSSSEVSNPRWQGQPLYSEHLRRRSKFQERGQCKRRRGESADIREMTGECDTTRGPLRGLSNLRPLRRSYCI